jgi:peptide-methionine (S)-S-oxide reductase
MKYIKLFLVLFFLSTQFSMAEMKTEKATFAGGCYWCMEEVFDHLEGVISATSGFANRVEAVEVIYDPQKISYEKLLDLYWHNIDPLDAEGQFCDRGPEYRSVIIFHDEEQKALAERSKSQVETLLNSQIATVVMAAESFTAAKDQDFYKTNPRQFQQYELRCGRKSRLQKLWGKKN